MSCLVRQEESDWKGFVRCVTCGIVIPYKEANAGHFIHGDCMDFIRENIHAQCVRCNKYLSGNLGKYAVWMIKKYGLKLVEDLYSTKNKVHKFTSEELQNIIKDLKSKIKGNSLE